MLLAALLASVAPTGCTKPIPTVPVTTEAFQRQNNPRTGYPASVVAQHNLQRVTDGDLTPAQRQASLGLVMTLQPTDPETLMLLAQVLADPTLPDELHRELLRLMLRQPDPSLTPFVVAVLQQEDLDPGLADQMLDWLSSNAGSGAFEEIVKIWAEHRPEGPHESRFRRIVERVQGRQWDQALVDALNDSSFYARGSALQILVHRINVTSLKRRLLNEATVTDTMAAIQTFIGGFDFLPLNRAALIQTVVAYKEQRLNLESMSHLASRWTYDPAKPYMFNSRDVPLTAWLVTDSRRAATTRAQLIRMLASERRGRRHARYRAGGQRSSRIETELARQIDDLSMADLWNLHLLDQLLMRGDIQEGITSMAVDDLADTSTANGGLIVFAGSEVEALRYPPGATGNNLFHVPSPRMRRDSRRAMCRFVTHFDKIDNAPRVGPTLEELDEARASNTYGLTITSINAETFSAYYYTPTGIVVSIGQFPFVYPLQQGE